MFRGCRNGILGWIGLRLVLVLSNRWIWLEIFVWGDIIEIVFLQTLPTKSTFILSETNTQECFAFKNWLISKQIHTVSCPFHEEISSPKTHNPNWTYIRRILCMVKLGRVSTVSLIPFPVNRNNYEIVSTKFSNTLKNSTTVFQNGMKKFGSIFSNIRSEFGGRMDS